ncbi:MAG: LuxR C-terminal-related transcriptional regulator [Gammaproteobacteria bacterium]|nr:LuxR C-terminal-related transcriptional regulator [Gammaproteobacteria bacterium]
MSEQRLYLHSLPLQAYKTLDFPVFIKNKNSQYLWANDFFINSAGCQSVTDVYNKHDLSFPWHNYSDELRSNDKCIFENEKGLSVRERAIRYEGTYVDFVSKKLPLFNEKQTIIGLLGFSIELPKMTMQMSLTKREYMCVLLMSEGYSDKEIGKKLQISPRTVESHIVNAKQKWRVDSRAELIVKFAKNNP